MSFDIPVEFSIPVLNSVLTSITQAFGPSSAANHHESSLARIDYFFVDHGCLGGPGREKVSDMAPSLQFLLILGPQTLRRCLVAFVPSSHFGHFPDQTGFECYIQNEHAPGTDRGVRRRSISRRLRPHRLQQWHHWQLRCSGPQG
jgi:hypothetical protein